MEYVDVYSENHIRTGITIERGEVPPQGGCLLVVHLCLFDRAGRMLLQRRSDSKDRYPGAWDVSAGGFVRSGEEPLPAALRETEEEVGVVLRGEDVRYLTTEPFSYVLDDFFAATVDESCPLHLQADEVTDVRWASREEVLAMRREGTLVDYAVPLLMRIFDAQAAGEEKNRDNDQRNK